MITEFTQVARLIHEAVYFEALAKHILHRLNLCNLLFAYIHQSLFVLTTRFFIFINRLSSHPLFFHPAGVFNGVFWSFFYYFFFLLLFFSFFFFFFFIFFQCFI